MANETPIYKMLDTVTKAVSSLGIPAYPLNRPDKVAESVKSFVVVDVPVRSRNLAHGDDGFLDILIGIVYVFHKCKSDGTPNIDGQTRLVESVRELFPIKGDSCECVRPRYLYDGGDGYGYQVTSLMFDIRLKKR